MCWCLLTDRLGIRTKRRFVVEYPVSHLDAALAYSEGLDQVRVLLALSSSILADDLRSLQVELIVSNSFRMEEGVSQHLIWLRSIARVVTKHPLHQFESFSRCSRHYVAQRYFRMVWHRKELTIS